jgi:hypothetical protein
VTKAFEAQGLLNADEAASPPQASLYGTIAPKAYPGIFDSWSQVVDRTTGNFHSSHIVLMTHCSL